MLSLMRFYVLHKNWRARLALNSAASNIWLCWIISLLFVAGLAWGAAFRSLDKGSALFLGATAVASFAASFAFLAEAKRQHAVRLAAGNAVFSEK
jgi:hypothetical protein